jgi:hypothetical protein
MWGTAVADSMGTCAAKCGGSPQCAMPDIDFVSHSAFRNSSGTGAEDRPSRRGTGQGIQIPTGITLYVQELIQFLEEEMNSEINSSGVHPLYLKK